MSYPLLAQTKGGYSRTSEDSVSIVASDSEPWPCGRGAGNVAPELVLETYSIYLFKADHSEVTAAAAKFCGFAFSSENTFDFLSKGIHFL